MYRYIILIITTLFLSCQESDAPMLDESILSDYISINADLEDDFVIACAAGKGGGMHGNAAEPTAIYFYPVDGAIDYRYYESNDIADSLDFDKYNRVDLPLSPLFNGYLQRWNRTAFDGERMAVVTYRTEDKLHISDPIRIKTTTKPTEVNAQLVDIDVQGTSVNFQWQDGIIDENVIYFQVISDSDGNLISGTYTYDRQWTFYDTSNVVLNITTDSNPTLEIGKNYSFTMMAVSEDNWVNLLIQKEFVAE